MRVRDVSRRQETESSKSSRSFCPGVRPKVSQTADAQGNALSISAAAMIPSLAYI